MQCRGLWGCISEGDLGSKSWAPLQHFPPGGGRRCSNFVGVLLADELGAAPKKDLLKNCDKFRRRLCVSRTACRLHRHVFMKLLLFILTKALNTDAQLMRSTKDFLSLLWWWSHKHSVESDLDFWICFFPERSIYAEQRWWGWQLAPSDERKQHFLWSTTLVLMSWLCLVS